MRYHEFALQPEMRTGLMIPVSSLPDFYARPDAGYCTVYQFDEAATFAIRAQGNAQGFGRFPVYSDRLWIDIDATDNSPEEVERVKIYVRELTRQFVALDYAFTVWDSGSKGFHICIKITPMFGKDVPWSQHQYVQQVMKLTCDYTLYQAGRLLSNPGRVHPKTGRKKTKVFEHRGSMILTVPMVTAPERPTIDSDSLTDSDLARIAFSRLTSIVLDTPVAGGRHTALWSVAMSCAEAGMDKDLIFGALCYVNKFLPNPKTKDEVERCVSQAQHQSNR